jgi:hypothetical protein
MQPWFLLPSLANRLAVTIQKANREWTPMDANLNAKMLVFRSGPGSPFREWNRRSVAGSDRLSLLAFIRVHSRFD